MAMEVPLCQSMAQDLIVQICKVEKRAPVVACRGPGRHASRVTHGQRIANPHETRKGPNPTKLFHIRGYDHLLFCVPL